MKKGAIIVNKYYADVGMEYIADRLASVFSSRNVILTVNRNTYCSYNDPQNKKADFDFALFFDKDISLAYFLERQGVRLFNSAKTTKLCDDKEKTYAELSLVKDINIPKTIVCPLIYDVNTPSGDEFLSYVTHNVPFPIVVKHHIGSQGRQVFKADNFLQLQEIFNKNRYIPHMYQEYVGGGNNACEDLRIYIVGKKPVFSVQRKNTTDFRSGVSTGGIMQKIEVPLSLKNTAQKIAEKLNLEYGSTDFIFDEKQNKYYFIEANSNAYMKTPETLGANLAEKLCDYILSSTL